MFDVKLEDIPSIKITEEGKKEGIRTDFRTGFKIDLLTFSFCLLRRNTN